MGNFCGSRPGVHTLPHSAITGLPLIADSRIFSFLHVVREPLVVAFLHFLPEEFFQFTVER